MSFKPPSDLIKQSQIGFRNNAGLSSYKPTLKSLPTVQNILSSSSHCIKCNNCNNKLLRGSHSLICIYCGQCQADDVHPQPIVFNSTAGYRLLLQSLELNASDDALILFMCDLVVIGACDLGSLEIVGSFFEEDRKNKGGTPREEGTTLAEHIDVQITWREETERPESGFVDEPFDLISFLNLTRAENFDTGSARGSDYDADEERSVGSRNDDYDTFTDQDNLSPFQNDAALEAADIFSGDDEEVQLVDSTTQNDAEFPSVDSRMQNEDSKTDDVSFDLRDDSPSARDTEVQSLNSMTRNGDSKTDMSRDSLSGGADLKSTMQNEDFKTAVVSSDLKERSSSEDDEQVQNLNLSTQNITENDDSKIVDMVSALRDGSSSEDDAKVEVLNLSTKNKDSKANADLSRDSSSGDDAEIQSLNVKTQNDDSKTVDVVSDLRDGSSSGDDARVQNLNSITQNEDVKVNADLSRKSSSGDDAEIQSLNFKTRNDDSKLVDVASILRDSSSSGDDAKGRFLNPSMQNEDSKRDSSSGDEAAIPHPKTMQK
ncbi:hypothetical protein HanOQP8_Chr03g0103481 [Helianthus annuus]|nr:hypothetical protein HanOQP8_Chr03g0103481 [Helianthus annuus]